MHEYYFYADIVTPAGPQARATLTTGDTAPDKMLTAQGADAEEFQSVQ